MEIAFAALFVVPATMKLGFILASCYFAGAIATELSHDVLKVNPFVPIILLWIGAFIRDRSIFFWYAIEGRSTPSDRAAYIHQVAQAVKQGGHVIVSRFGPEGPTKRSGLNVVRYDSESLHNEFAVHFQLLGSTKELHQTPFETTQQFLYCYCRVE